MKIPRLLLWMYVGASVLAWRSDPAYGGSPGPVSAPGVINYDVPNWANSPLPRVTVSTITVVNGGSGYTVAPAVTITGLAGSDTGTATIAGGIVTAITANTPATVYYGPPTITIAPPLNGTPAAAIPSVTVVGGGLRKFVDSLAGLTGGARPTDSALGANNLGQFIPLASADNVTYGATNDYYEIGLVEYTERMHSDMPDATRIRGYVQLETAVKNVASGSAHYALTNLNGTAITNAAGAPLFGYTQPHYLGPIILAHAGKPTRIKFYNLLPTGAAGHLFVPIDTTIMGAGMASNGTFYAQNRATLHLHGGLTPWISDGTPHQWTVPSGEPTGFKKGVSTRDVPDMPATGDGTMTFYYPNAQSGRLMFYHDHAYGTTRLNVYTGEAAGYLLVDPIEEAIPGLPGTTADLTHLIPLVIQDKTFVPDTTQLGLTDPLWLNSAQTWAGNVPPTAGNMWWPHVYMPNQNPSDPTGANPLGRWDFGPWFWPPQVVANLQAMPTNSLVPETFVDTPLINGTVYPYLNVAPAKYRLRILNACNDRMVNLQMYVADPLGYAIDATGAPVAPGTGFGTEIAMIAATPNPAVNFPAAWLTQTPGMIPDVLDSRPGGIPNPTNRGPAFIQIGTEGGLLPAPVLLRNTPVGYEQNKRNIVVLNVAEKTLFMGPAERADVIVDFTQFAGKTVILYNDSPAPVPAGDPRNDYYTGNLDNTVQGGAPSTMPGYGPNTRTIMQFRVSGSGGLAPQDDYDAAFLATLTTNMATAYTNSQPAPIVPQLAYPGSYQTTSGSNTYAQIADLSMTFIPYGSAAPVTYQMKNKALHELFDEFGRMNSVLGVEIPFTTFTIQTTIPYKYIDPITESIAAGETQIWKLTHNGVDTHAIHFHLFNVQVINRVGWDGAVRPPDANELGWKETVRMNPLEDVIVAATAVKPPVPFVIGNSIRPLDVTQPLGTSLQFTGVDPNGNPVTTLNAMTDFGHEYVWHCHLLGHEENDMMRPLVLRVTGTPPVGAFALTATVAGPPLHVDLAWNPPTGTPVTYTIKRSTAANPNWPAVAVLATVPLTALSFSDYSAAAGTTYKYEVTSGTATSSVATVTTPSIPATPGNLQAVLGPGTPFVMLNWPAVPANVAGITLQRATNPGFTAGLTVFTLAPTLSNYVDTVTAGATFYYRIYAFNAAGTSVLPSNTQSVTTPAAVATPGTPTIATPSPTFNLIQWNANGTSQMGFFVWRSSNGTSWTLLTTTTATNYRDNSGTTPSTFYYRIQAYNAFGVSPYSGVLKIVK